MAWTAPENFPFPLGDLHPNLVHGSVGLPKSSPKTACQSVQLFLHSTPQSVPLLYNGLLRFPPKNAHSHGGLGPPSNTWYLGPAQVINQNGISIGSVVFVWIPNAMLYNAITMGKKTPKLPLPREISSPCLRRIEPWP